jgi:hypothetical protein
MSQNLKELQTNIRDKITGLIAEFGAGEISTHQFNVLYERYNTQLEMVFQAEDELQSGQILGSDMSTFAIKESTAGKAVGMGIYHHASGTMIETLGNFDLPVDIIAPILNRFSEKIDNNEYIEPTIRAYPHGIWVLFMAREYTTAVVIFRNEPAQRQIRQLERLLHDFEEANQQLLIKQDVDPTRLGKPFLGFVRKSLDG